MFNVHFVYVSIIILLLKQFAYNSVTKMNTLSKFNTLHLHLYLYQISQCNTISKSAYCEAKNLKYSQISVKFCVIRTRGLRQANVATELKNL